MPEDYTNTTFTSVAKEMLVTVYMEPCVVTNYSDTVRVVELRYTLGTPGLIDGFYQFD